MVTPWRGPISFKMQRCFQTLIENLARQHPVSLRCLHQHLHSDLLKKQDKSTDFKGSLLLMVRKPDKILEV